MKKKSLAWLLSLLMILSLNFTFTSCSDDDDDDAPSNVIENVLWVPTKIECNCGDNCTIDDLGCFILKGGTYYVYDSNDPNNLGEAETHNYKIDGNKITCTFEFEGFKDEISVTIVSSSATELVLKDSEGDITTYKAN